MGFYTKNGGLIGTGQIKDKRGVYDLVTSQVIGDSLFPFTQFTFTNAIATGQSGPSRANCLSSYNTVENSWLNDTEFFNVVVNGYQLWTVPDSGTYQITAVGAAGGSGLTGRGAGASLRGDFSLTKGQKLKIVVGQLGLDGNNACGGLKGGGGGGSFVVSEDNSTAYVIAGGGGGGSAFNTGSNKDAVTGTTGQPGSDGGGLGGTNGGGGFTQTTGCVNGASGGGGFTGNGQNGLDTGTTGGQSFTNGAIGGNGGTQYGGTAAAGGFGGGGGSSSYMGGGGGGYSGGGSGGVASCNCNNVAAGGGGASFNSGTNKQEIGAFNGTTHGSVIIQKL